LLFLQTASNAPSNAPTKHAHKKKSTSLRLFIKSREIQMLYFFFVFIFLSLLESLGKKSEKKPCRKNVFCFSARGAAPAPGRRGAWLL
jgi:hypothetical protein